jgi:16S rRNA (guanine966-N2)-methyltransferase
MRIISGALKGRPIKFLKNTNTRPLKNNVRENIFNILSHSKKVKVNISNSNILDLYSGIGSFGIECVSRGAKKVTFIEQDLLATKSLKENLIKLSIIDSTKVYFCKIEEILNKNINDKFDVIFFDPPFKDSSFLENLKTIKKKKLFNTNHILIIHREHKSKDDLNELLEIIEIKIYGRSKILFAVFK